MNYDYRQKELADLIFKNLNSAENSEVYRKFYDYISIPPNVTHKVLHINPFETFEKQYEEFQIIVNQAEIEFHSNK